MAFKSFAVSVGGTDTDVIECPATQEGAAVLNISNITGGASSYTVKLYKQADDATTTIASGVAIAANTSIKYPAPLSMQAGDKIIMVAPAESAIVATGTFTYSASAPAAVGFTPRGEYSGAAEYAINDVVHFTDGNAYLSLQSGNTGNPPDVSPAYWMVLSEKGEQGNGDLSSAANLSDLSDIAAARINLGVQIGVDVQPYDAALSSLIRQNSQSAAYVISANDGGYDIFHPASDNNARTFTIPANASVAFPIGTVISITNMINTVTIAITSDTLTFLGSGATGSRTLAANGMAVARKVAPTHWVICGVNLS